MTIELVPFEPEAHFTTPERQMNLLIEAFESGDAAFLGDAIGIVARARGIDLPIGSEELSLPALLAIAKELGLTLTTAA